jgi:hypothetical protein
MNAVERSFAEAGTALLEPFSGVALDERILRIRTMGRRFFPTKAMAASTPSG